VRAERREWDAVTAQTAVPEEPRGRPECWCCGRIEEPARLVHLGNYPEVTVCIRCAHSISKWAAEIEDQSRTGIAVRVRDELRRLRKTVVARGWHHNRLIGRPLRWLGRRMP
jgi:hypothetical protein